MGTNIKALKNLLATLRDTSIQTPRKHIKDFKREIYLRSSEIYKELEQIHLSKVQIN